MKEGAQRAALIGLIGLAAAMGIGRFAFTPMLPLMQAHGSVSLPQGGYLASANYVGYLLGALLSFAVNPRPADATRLGLVAVAVSTLAMAFTSSFLAWLGLRLVAGVASAFVLVGVSAWALAVLAAHQRSTWSGWVFAGVGTGILVAGLAVFVIGTMGLAPALGWLVLGGAASLVALFVACSITDTAPSATALRAAAPSGLDRTAWRLIACYGAFGFGYIIPATFLPAAARALVNDPTVFGWTWPVFGLAAATSTVVAAVVLGNFAPRRSWALGQMIMAAGVVLPAVQMTLLSMIVSAVCVGGTFMVITMAGMQEARRIGGRSAPRLMAAMTAAFATGQLAGPLTVTAADSAAEAIRGPSLLAAALLFFAALALLPGSETTGQQNNTNSATRSPK
ncbi:MAG: YbfB/YjiJ family MFS transporter [Xanthobacteraceae bacterium]